MANKDIDIEDTFLKDAIEKGKFTTIYLLNGIKLQGNVCGFNNSSILLQKPDAYKDTPCIVFKHAIATMM